MIADYGLARPSTVSVDNLYTFVTVTKSAIHGCGNLPQRYVQRLSRMCYVHFQNSSIETARG